MNLQTEMLMITLYLLLVIFLLGLLGFQIYKLDQLITEQTNKQLKIIRSTFNH